MIHLPLIPAHIRSLGVESGEMVDEISDEAYASPQRCPTCGGTGTFRWYVRDSVEWLKQQPRRDPNLCAEYECPHAGLPEQWVLYRNLLDVNIGLHYQRLSLADFQADTQEVVLDYLMQLHVYRKAGVGLLLHGDMGTGKTLTGVLIAKAALFYGYSAYYSTFAEMVTRYRSDYKWKEAARVGFYRSKIESSDFLVMDEVGRESRQGYSASIANEALMAIDLVIRRRIERGLPTVVTTNLDPETVEQAYGANIRSLLSSCDSHHFTGEDYRSENRTRTLTEAKAGLTRPITLVPVGMAAS